MHQLLTHTSGVPDHGRLLQEIPVGLTNQQVLEVVKAESEPDFEPGSQFSYSNSGYVLLSMIVEKASGKPFHRFMADRLFRPLGMHRTLVYDVTQPEIENRALGFTPEGELADYDLLTTGAGGMYSTSGDLAIWDAALDHKNLIQPGTLKRAFSATQLSNGESSPYGYGWGLHEDGGRKVVSHTGGLRGFRTFIGRDIERRNTIIMLSNSGDTMDFDQLNEAITAILSGQEPTLPKIQISRHVRQLIDQKGVASALAAYEKIRQTSSDRFALGVGQLNALGYDLMARGDIESAIKVFEKNVEAFPEDSNVYDSLGEAYMAQSMRREAIINYARSLVLNPDNDNAILMLERLRSRD